MATRVPPHLNGGTKLLVPDTGIQTQCWSGAQTSYTFHFIVSHYVISTVRFGYIGLHDIPGTIFDIKVHMCPRSSTSRVATFIDNNDYVSDNDNMVEVRRPLSKHIQVGIQTDRQRGKQ